MSVFIPKGFARMQDLLSEGCCLIAGQSDHALRIGLLNLMPEKKIAERQFARMLNASPLDTQLLPLKLASHAPRHCETAYMDKVYQLATREKVASLDGLIITGAPVEHLDFADVDYWCELSGLLDSLKVLDVQTLFICWAAQAALYRYYGIAKHRLAQKAFGVFPQYVFEPGCDLVAGIDRKFPTPVSRHTTTHTMDILQHRPLRLVAGSHQSGPALIDDRDTNSTYMFNHLEYESDTLQQEYLRDLRKQDAMVAQPDKKRLAPPASIDERSWEPSARRFFVNWLARMGDRNERRKTRAPSLETAA